MGGPKLKKGNVKKYIFTLISGLLISFFIILFNGIMFSNWDKHAVFDSFLNFKIPGSPPKDVVGQATVTKDNPDVSKNIVIIGVDKRTLEPSKLGRFPFPREYYIPYFNNFLDDNNKSYPAGILFDIAFLSKKEEEKEIDEKLAQVIKLNDNVAMEYYLETSPPEYEPNQTKLKDTEYIVKNYTLPINKIKIYGKPITKEYLDKFNQIWKDLLPTTEPFNKAAKVLGAPSFVQDSDKKNRRIPLIYIYQNRVHFNIVFQLIMHYYGVTMKDIDIDLGRYITINNIRKNSKVKTLKIPVSIRGEMLIDFVGNAGQLWKVRSFYDVYKKRIPPKFFKDKYVFTGIYTRGVASDVLFTPVGLMYGVEYIALAFNQLINQQFYNFLNTGISYLIIIFIAFLMVYLFSRLPIIQTYGLMFLSILIYTLIAYFAFTKKLIIPYTSVIFTIFISLVTMIVYRIFTEEKEKRFIRATFSNFVSKVVVDELLKHPEMIKLGGEKKLITVLFSDIRSFTTISERLSPEDTVQVLNGYLSIMTDIIFKYHGTLDKYVGDEIMAFWGAPVPQEDHALLSCFTALEMMEKLHEFNKNMPEDRRLNIGIGINTGEAIVGNMGSTSRMDYTLVGDHVNTGARLEGTNKVYGTNIIISEYTYKYVKDFVVVRLLDRIRVKGKSIPIHIYELLDIKENVDKEKILKKYGK